MAEQPERMNFLDFKPDIDNIPSGIAVIGDGEIGGKAKGLWYTKHIIENEGTELCDHPEMLEIPHSTIVTTQVFDEVTELNAIDRAVAAKCNKAIELIELNRRILVGIFPKWVDVELEKVLQRETDPLIVRSSSLLEDNLHYSFAGIYQSVFISNNGTRRQRLAQLKMAMKIVYASTYGLDAKEYRAKHKIDWHEEKMAILVQRAIGSEHSTGLYYPLFAGVGLSQNYYPWSSRIKPEDGVVRLVFGFGTRAVGRYFAKVFSPGLPNISPEGSVVSDVLRYSQGALDAIDLETGMLVTRDIEDVKLTTPDIYMVSSRLKDGEVIMDSNRLISPDERLVMTFKQIVGTNRHLPFVPLIKSLLRNLERTFGLPVDIEFAVNFEDFQPKFYLVQVRPLGAGPGTLQVDIPKVPQERTLLMAKGVLGTGKRKGIRHVVYVPIDKYNLNNAYEIARVIGELNENLTDRYILIGPGRWGTTHPDLGVPVKYSEISNAGVVVELSGKGFTPEFSYGTHLFQDMVASGMLYIPLYKEKGDFLNEEMIVAMPNKSNSDYVYFVEFSKGLSVYADGRTRQAIVVKGK